MKLADPSTHVPTLREEDVEALLTGTKDAHVAALAADWLLLNTERRVLSRFILTHHPQVTSGQNFERHLLPDSVYARFGREVLEELWRRISLETPGAVDVEVNL